MLKKIFSLLIFLFLLLPCFTFGEESEKAILYYGNGCPHCSSVEKYIKEQGLENEIIQKEIYQNSQNAEEFNQICEQEGIGLRERGVPFLYAKGECFVGDKQIITYLKLREKDEKVEKEVKKTKEEMVHEREVAEEKIEKPALSVNKKFEGKEEKEEGNKTQEIKENFSENLTLPLLFGAALVDAVNPCAFAVLLILMTTVLSSGSKKRALYSGIAFSLSIFISYLLMGLGLYSIVSTFETSKVFMKIIGGLAIFIGIFNLKDFFWYGKGFLMEVPMSWRPKLKKLIHSITSPIGAFLIGFLISLFLLPCTSGPYIVIIGMLGHKEVFLKAIWLLILYNLIFVLPMIGITLGAYFGMNVQKAEEKRVKNLKTLHLIAGIIMFAMGFFLLFGM